mmetsp:Transcript_30474/g.78802  ORF Transcript_30474/g.78802 Transcript_30474/m.78802 type:complete len:257 (-) Transcript_30474:245-1015(-)
MPRQTRLRRTSVSRWICHGYHMWSCANTSYPFTYAPSASVTCGLPAPKVTEHVSVNPKAFTWSWSLVPLAKVLAMKLHASSPAYPSSQLRVLSSVTWSRRMEDPSAVASSSASAGGTGVGVGSVAQVALHSARMIGAHLCVWHMAWVMVCHDLVPAAPPGPRSTRSRSTRFWHPRHLTSLSSWLVRAVAGATVVVVASRPVKYPVLSSHSQAASLSSPRQELQEGRSTTLAAPGRHEMSVFWKVTGLPPMISVLRS